MHNTKKTDTYKHMYICTCVSTHIHTMPTNIGTCVCTEKHAHNCSFINVKGFRLLLQHYLINPICGAGEKQNRNTYVYRQNTNKSSRKRNERDGDGEKTEKPNLPMYNQFNYFYEIVFSVWFIFGFAFCLLPYMPYTLFLTGTTHTHNLNKIV